jgi:hypothetical protein
LFCSGFFVVSVHATLRRSCAPPAQPASFSHGSIRAESTPCEDRNSLRRTVADLLGGCGRATSTSTRRRRAGHLLLPDATGSFCKDAGMRDICARHSHVVSAESALIN